MVIEGLSPRGRGNRRLFRARRRFAGPIPARAGEPGSATSATCGGRAYPRAGGGTLEAHEAERVGEGLSPRGRGNRNVIDDFRHVKGPIPARAGEPHRSTAWWCRKGAYPRAGGGTILECWSKNRFRGLSPRGRGNHPAILEVGRRGGLSPRGRGNPEYRGPRAPARGPIPARAGEPGSFRAGCHRFKAYPRAGGGTQRPDWIARLGEGLSPRGRGNPEYRGPRAPARGPIPARAGEPGSFRAGCHRFKAYPRAGGGTQRPDWIARLGEGLSPRGRGNHLRAKGCLAGGGLSPRGRGNHLRAKGCLAGGGLSPRGRGNRADAGKPRTPSGPIPARAGEPLLADRVFRAFKAYPRAGGGTPAHDLHGRGGPGLSPRGRGNPAASLTIAARARPIPARAGEPPPLSAPWRTPWAYPRAGGGTGRTVAPAAGDTGLSPRGRGNPHWRDRRPERIGPIPARAGEPASMTAISRFVRAYPRAGGGTFVAAVAAGAHAGLSPRGRGNPFNLELHAHAHGPIPARAGEPLHVDAAKHFIGAYPRAGGGTITDFRLLVDRSGLSPRGRGNLGPWAGFLGDARPIPARAGEPVNVRLLRCMRGAYPRAGGGTNKSAEPLEVPSGLSPRGRGNRHWQGGRGGFPGPIPARAGEPYAHHQAMGGRRAYPRAGGGTKWRNRTVGRRRGLSPRGRGNQYNNWEYADCVGPIPARAGEPMFDKHPAAAWGAYPRAGGGTETADNPADILKGLSPRGRGNRTPCSTFPISPGPIPARAGEP